MVMVSKIKKDDGIPVGIIAGALETDEAVQTLSALMGSGVGHFAFRKTDGTVREAYGTLSATLIPKFKAEEVNEVIEAAQNLASNLDKLLQNANPKSSELEAQRSGLNILSEALQPFAPKEKKPRKPNENLVTYYDLVAGDWRSFNKNQLVTIY